jgi:hypothetical protein
VSQPRVAEKISRGRDSLVMRNLPLPFIEVTFLAARASDIPVQGASSFSIPVDLEPVVLAYHREQNCGLGDGSSGMPP